MRRRTRGVVLALLAALGGCGRARDTIFEGYAFVAAAGSSAVTVVDLASFTVHRRIALPSRPLQLVPHPAGKTLYILEEAGLTALDVATLEIWRTVAAGERPQRFRLAPAGDRLYVLDTGSPALRVVELPGLSAGASIRLPAAPVDFDLSPDGRRGAVSLVSGEVMLLDLESGRATATVRAGSEPTAVAVRYDGRQVFVANRGDRTLTAIDLVSSRVLAHLPLGARPEVMRFKPDGGELFVSGGDMGVVLIVSAYRDEVDQPLMAGAEPRDLAISADNRILYVANSGADTVSAINIQERRTLAAVPVGDEPCRVALTPDNQFALVLNRRSGDMAVLRRRLVEGGREKIRPLFTMIPVGSRPVDLVVQAR